MAVAVDGVGLAIEPGDAIAAALCHDIVDVPKNSPKRAEASTLSAHEAFRLLKHHGFEGEQLDTIAEAIRESVIKPVVPSNYLDERTKFFINPTGIQGDARFAAGREDLLFHDAPDAFPAVSVHKERAPELPASCILLADTPASTSTSPKDSSSLVSARASAAANSGRTSRWNGATACV